MGREKENSSTKMHENAHRGRSRNQRYEEENTEQTEITEQTEKNQRGLPFVSLFPFVPYSLSGSVLENLVEKTRSCFLFHEVRKITILTILRVALGTSFFLEAYRTRFCTP